MLSIRLNWISVSQSMLRVGKVKKYFLSVDLFNKQQNCAFISVSASSLICIFCCTVCILSGSFCFYLPFCHLDVSQNLHLIHTLNTFIREYFRYFVPEVKKHL